MQWEAEQGNARIPARRHPAVLLGLFFAIFALQVFIALQGYRYIGLSSEYASRNLIHLDAVTEAQIDLEQSQIGIDFPLDKLTSLVATARDQAVWCIENLSPIERRVLSFLGAGAALDICITDIRHADFALDLLNRLSRPPDADTPMAERPFALTAQLAQTLRLMLEDSRDFAPHVVDIRAKISHAVQTGTGVAGAFILILATLLSRTFLSNWRSLSLQSREILRQSNRFKLAMQSNVDGLALFDAQMHLISFNENFATLLFPKSQPEPGQVLSSLLERAVSTGTIVAYPGNGTALMAEIRSAMAGSQDTGFQVELTGDRHVILTMAETGFGDVLLLVKDITLHVRSDREKEAHAREMQEINARIRESSRLDPLTGLVNRRGLDDAMQTRPDDGETTLIRIDLDRFKQVNDVFGHEAGDHVLVHVSRLLRDSCREGDIPVRVGGDEFLILCAPGTDETRATALANRLLEKVREPVIYNGKQLVFGASFGVASSSEAEENLGTLLRSADAALYEAKKNGRSTVTLFSADLRDALKRDRALAETFLPALGSGEIRAFAQSIHNANDWSLAGVEVLARWQHPDFGLLVPSDFLHVVKQLGMEADLDAYVFTTALDEMREIERGGFHFPRISFNVSAGRLLDPTFQEIILDSMMYWDRRVAFEILETISVDEGSTILSQLKRLKALGVEFDVDDFGSGHASINSVIDIGPSTVKIDRKIISPLGEKEAAETMIKAIVEMGRAMNVRITAEGIENKEQADIVRRLGGDRLQGYFFSKPMPLRDLIAHIATHDMEPRTAAGSS